MPAYMLVEVAIHNPTLYEEYKKRTPAILEAFDGKFLLRGLPVFALEGSWDQRSFGFIGVSYQGKSVGLVPFDRIPGSKGNSR